MHFSTFRYHVQQYQKKAGLVTQSEMSQRKDRSYIKNTLVHQRCLKRGYFRIQLTYLKNISNVQVHNPQAAIQHRHPKEQNKTWMQIRKNICYFLGSYQDSFNPLSFFPSPPQKK